MAPCTSCGRHLREAGEPCRFCGAGRRVTLTSAAVVLLGLSLQACEGSTLHPLYGASPTDSETAGDTGDTGQ